MTSHQGTPAPELAKKRLILNAFVESCEYSLHPLKFRGNRLTLSGSGHQSPGLWTHPRDESYRFNEVEHWVKLATKLEAAKFHGIFIADVLGQFDNLDVAPLTHQ